MVPHCAEASAEGRKVREMMPKKSFLWDLKIRVGVHISMSGNSRSPHQTWSHSNPWASRPKCPAQCQPTPASFWGGLQSITTISRLRRSNSGPIWAPTKGPKWKGESKVECHRPCLGWETPYHRRSTSDFFNSQGNIDIHSVSCVSICITWCKEPSITI